MRTRATRAGAAGFAAALLLSACSTGDQDPRGPDSETGASTVPRTDVAPQDAAAAFTPPAVPTGQPGRPRGLDVDADTVDVNDVDQVAQAFAATKLTADTAIDIAPADVDRRAARWMSPEYADQQTQPRSSGGGAEWLSLSQNRGYYSVVLQQTAAAEQGLITTAPDALSAERPYIAQLTAHDASLPEQSFAVVVYLTRTDTDAPWTVYDWYQETSYE